MLLIAALACLTALADAKVSFTTSTLYDEYDLNGNAEIGLNSCEIGGCSVYVSVPQWNVEVTKNLFVYATGGTNVSLYSYATDVDVVTNAKNGLHLSNTQYTIKNYNKDYKVGPITIYVVGAQAPLHGQVEVYDAAMVSMRPATSKQQTMIMSVEPYNLYVEAYGVNPLTAYIRATGYDNNFQKASPDNCRIIYDHSEAKPFRLRINSPIITINFDGQNTYKICANIDQNNGAAMDYPGIATSQGYVGCDANFLAVYRSTVYTSNVFELKDSHNTDRQTELSYVAKTIQTDKVAFTTYYNGGSNNFEASGNGQLSTVTRTENANRISVVMTNGYGSSYWLKYTPKTGATTIPSAQGICPDWTKTSTVPPGSQTVPTVSPTTSGASDLFTVLTSSIVLFIARQI